MSDNSFTVEEYNRRQQTLYAARTGIVVDIQEIGKNTRQIAIAQQPSLHFVRSGVWLRTHVLRFPDGNFSNVYDLFWSPEQETIHTTIRSSNEPYYLLQRVKEDPSIIAIMNGSFFFLADQADRVPLDLVYNLCIREGKIVGLPSRDDPVAFIRGGQLETKAVQACGEILVGTTRVPWIGAKSSLPQKAGYATLYNSKCSDVIKEKDPQSGVQIGILDSKHITTPRSPQVFDLVVRADADGALRVAKIVQGGGTHYFNGHFILQCTGSMERFAPGDIVRPQTLDGLRLDDLSAGLTIGKSVHDPFFFDSIRAERRDARSVLAKDRQGYMHMIAFDGSKYIPDFHGVSARDLQTFFSPEKFEWAYFLDGGGSTRLIVREKADIKILANEFAFQKLEDGTHVWDWKKGRMVTSSIALKVLGD